LTRSQIKKALQGEEKGVPAVVRKPKRIKGLGDEAE
jgi:hypothetical protein